MKRFSLCILIAVAFLCLLHKEIYSQEELFGGKKHKLGLTSGYGFDDVITTHADYYYRVVFFTIQYQYTIHRRGTFGIDLLAEAQFNLTDYIYDVVWTPGKKKGIEFGVHPGILFRKNFWEDELSIFASLIVGPHYITGSLNRQASGFIFSDNLILGMDIRLAESLYMQMNFGFRHISPAGLTYPHDGINNIIVNAGFFYLLPDINSKSQKTNSK
jgi:hypothetical protein